MDGRRPGPPDEATGEAGVEPCGRLSWKGRCWGLDGVRGTGVGVGLAKCKAAASVGAGGVAELVRLGGGGGVGTGDGRGEMGTESRPALTVSGDNARRSGDRRDGRGDGTVVPAK